MGILSNIGKLKEECEPLIFKAGEKLSFKILECYEGSTFVKLNMKVLSGEHEGKTHEHFFNMSNTTSKKMFYDFVCCLLTEEQLTEGASPADFVGKQIACKPAAAKVVDGKTYQTLAGWTKLANEGEEGFTP